MLFDQSDFLSKYKGKASFVETSPYYSTFLSFLDNADLINHVIFCNDVLQLPPVYVFVKYYKDVFVEPLSTNDKRGLGACFGYLFQHVYRYGSARSIWVGEKTTGIKNASYFLQ